MKRNSYTKGDTVEVFCPRCNKNCSFTKSQRFLSFPRILVVAIQREVIEGLMLKKLPIQVAVPVDKLNAETYRAPPRSPSETLIEPGIMLGTKG